MTCIDCCYSLLKDGDIICTYEDGNCIVTDRMKRLEKENAELKIVKIPQLERKIASIRGCHSVDCRKLNARTEQVERLKQEIAELKEDVKYYEQKHERLVTEWDNAKRQLTKAKEIIREFVEWATWKGSNCPSFKSIQDKAEQFLKEEVE